MVPDALRQLRILKLPVGCRGNALCAAEFLRLVHPRTATSGARVKGFAIAERVGNHILDRPVNVRDELVGRPFADVAVHIVQPPGIGFLRADLLVFEITVTIVPGVVVEHRWIIPKTVRCSGARTAGVLPLCLGRQPVIMPGLGCEPFAVNVGRMLRHADRGKAIRAHAKTHLDVRRGRPGHGIGNGVKFRFESAQLHHHLFLLLIHEQRVAVPCRLCLGHPERGDLHLVLRPLICVVTFFRLGTAHDKFPTRDRYHFKLHPGTGNLIRVRFHRWLELLDQLFDCLDTNIDHFLGRSRDGAGRGRAAFRFTTHRLEF